MAGSVLTTSAELVMRELVDLLIGENLAGFADRLRPGLPTDPPPGLATATLHAGEEWVHVHLPGAGRATGWVCFRARVAGPPQPYRLSRPPVWWYRTSDPSEAVQPDQPDQPAGPRPLRPDELLTLLIGDCPAVSAQLPHAPQLSEDLRTAVSHTAVLTAGRARLAAPAPGPGELINGERLAATRNRPFHPVSRAVIGWTGTELARYGPMRPRPLGLDWVAVRRDRLRHGRAAASSRLHEMILTEHDQQRLLDALRRAGVGLDKFQPIPVHPWQFDHVLRRVFATELARSEVVALTRGLGAFHPTASVRTLTTAPETDWHVKLPLGVTTLGAARLLPPRYLDNGQRAQRTMRQLIDRCPLLRARVDICDEHIWCGWQPPDGDEFDDRGGHLAAQLRRYPAGLLDDPTRLVLPMAALGAHEWDVLGPAVAAAGFGLAPGRPGGPVAGPVAGPAARAVAVQFFRLLAEAFCELGLGFLRFGVLPELHGQNVLVVLREGAVDKFVLRDHDTLRLYPEWMALERVADPEYRIRPGAAQSLRLPSARALLGYLQTLGFQVNLGAITDALGNHYEIPERRLWAQLRAAVLRTLDRIRLPSRLRDLAERELLRSRVWPSRLVLGPLLRQGRSDGVSMPAEIGRVPNPLAPAAGAAERARASAEQATAARVLNCFLRETGVPATLRGTLLRVPLPRSDRVLLAEVTHWSQLGPHSFGDGFQVMCPADGPPGAAGTDGADSAGVPIGHHELIALLLTELRMLAAAANWSAGDRRCAELAAQIDNSVLHTARYLRWAERPDAQPPVLSLVTAAQALTRQAEQSLRYGHPFHPTPKSAEGFSPDDLEAYAPELGASFPLHYFVAVDAALLSQDQVRDGPRVPPEVLRQARQQLGPDLPEGALLPAHPWQAGYLRRQRAIARLLAEGRLVALGPLGRPVYPTSSVRTVCDPGFPTAWKLPLHVRITNFVRNNPAEHVRRALDASRAIESLRDGWDHDDFEILLETGYRTIGRIGGDGGPSDDPNDDLNDDSSVELSADIAVLYRENPFAVRDQAPQVVAGLLEPGQHGCPPVMIRYLWQAAEVAGVRRTTAHVAGHVADWLRRYLEISLVPLLELFTGHGVSLEAHVQNSLLALRDGWPASFYVRDMEGTSLSRQRWVPSSHEGMVPPDSPALYDDAEAWSRWKYYIMTNHVGHLTQVLARYTVVDESVLWRVVRDVVRAAGPSRYTRDLLDAPTLPAKANLISRFTGRAETPLYVAVRNPLVG